jgi:hypothetical protein
VEDIASFVLDETEGAGVVVLVEEEEEEVVVEEEKEEVVVEEEVEEKSPKVQQRRRQVRFQGLAQIYYLRPKNQYEDSVCGGAETT